MHKERLKVCESLVGAFHFLSFIIFSFHYDELIDFIFGDLYFVRVLVVQTFPPLCWFNESLPIGGI
jgi:hypothetical protein